MNSCGGAPALLTTSWSAVRAEPAQQYDHDSDPLAREHAHGARGMHVALLDDIRHQADSLAGDSIVVRPKKPYQRPRL